MDDGYLAFRSYLEGLSRPKLRRLCEIAGLNEKETELITMYYCDKKSEDYIADHMQVSKSTCHRMKRAQIERIRRQLHLDLYRPEVTSYKERIKLIDEMLYKS